MGLDTSHDCWHGAYSAFMRWRHEIARAAGLPPLSLMDGFYSPGEALSDPFWAANGMRDIERHGIDLIKTSLPIKWSCLKPDPLYLLLHHSDCEGEIAAADCAGIADSLERILPNMPDGDGGGHIGVWRDKTQAFINGLRRAAAAGEPVDFH